MFNNIFYKGVLIIGLVTVGLMGCASFGGVAGADSMTDKYQFSVDGVNADIGTVTKSGLSITAQFVNLNPNNRATERVLKDANLEGLKV